MEKYKKIFELFAVVVIVISLFMTSQAYATSMTFTSDTIISDDVTIENGDTWIINPGVIVTIDNGVELTIEDGGSLENYGLIENNGTITNDGTITNFDCATITGNDVDNISPVSSGVCDRIFDIDTIILSNETIQDGHTWIINPGVIVTIDKLVTVTIDDGGTLLNNGLLVMQFESDLFNFGLIDNFGQITIYDVAELVIDGTLIIEDGATIIINNNVELVIIGSLIIEPDGTLVIYSDYKNNGIVSILEDGTLDNEGQIFINDHGILEIDGNLIINNGGSVTNDGLIDNQGQIIINVGSLVTNDGIIITNRDGSLDNFGIIDNFGQIINFELITLQSGALINNFYLIENQGTFTNIGTITNFDCAAITGNGVFDGTDPVVQGVCTTPANHRIFTSDTIISDDEIILDGETWIINENVTVTIIQNADITVENGAELVIDGLLIIDNGRLVNFGHIFITHKGVIINNDVLRIRSSGSVDNYNLIENFDTINNQGTITNIDCGTITRNAVGNNDPVSEGMCDLLPVDFDSIDHIEVDINYHIDSQTVIIDYDFGENPYRESCLFKAEVFLKYNGVQSGFAYAGDDITIVYPTSINIIRMGLIYPLIDCSGRIIFEHVKDFPTSNPEFLNFNGSFYTVVKEQFRGEFSNIYYLLDSGLRINGIKLEHNAEFVMDSNAIIVDEVPVCHGIITSDEFTLIYDLVTLIKFHVDSTDIDNNCILSYESQLFPDPNEYFATVDYTPPANTSHHNTSTSTKKKSGGCADCTPPTFGKNKHGVLIVTDGFSYNGNSTDVTDYHTSYPLITAVTNQTNTVLVKVYENEGVDNIKIVQFGLGMPEIGSPISNAQTLIEIWLVNSQVIDLVQVDKNNLVTISNLETSVVDCGGINGGCLAVKLQYYYRDQPKYNIMAINAMDYSRNPQTNYLNAGVEVIGESLNEPLTQKVAVSDAGAFYPQKRGLVTLTLVDYKTDIWIDEYGYIWSTNEHGPYLVDIITSPERISDDISPWSGYSDRLHSEFGDYLKMEQEKAAIILDAITSLP